MDQDIWNHINKGNKEAYERMYVHYYKRLYNYGRKFTNNIALIEDTLQEALLSIWTGRANLTGIHAPDTYLLTTFRYLLFRKIREAGKLGDINDLQLSEPEFGAEHLIIKKEEALLVQEKLKRAIEHLTSRQREAIFLRFFEGLTYKQVAEVLNVSVKATYKMMARALEQLKTALAIPMIALLLLLKSFANG